MCEDTTVAVHFGFNCVRITKKSICMVDFFAIIKTWMNSKLIEKYFFTCISVMQYADSG